MSGVLENTEDETRNEVENTDMEAHECQESNGTINDFKFLLTNARSLPPKIDSFVENFEEHDVDLAVVTETWLYEGSELLSDGAVDLDLGEGIGTVHIGREGRRGGGMGIFYRKHRMKVDEIALPDNEHEILATICSVQGLRGK